jgi:hypothetical protein
MATYITETYYTDTFGGVTVPSESFAKYAKYASKKIDRFTFNRAADIISDDDDADQVTAIKMATCEVMDEMFNQDESFYGGRSIRSESVGGHSVAYADSPESKRSLLEKQKEAARLWLEETYLMFPGFYTGEYGSSVDDGDDL